MNKKRIIDENGWIIVRNVFTSEEIIFFREMALKSRDHKGDILSNVSLKQILFDDRVLNIFKEVLGSESLFYFGDSSVSIDVKNNGFHKDSRDRLKSESREWNDTNYSLIRMGLYLQDHVKHSGGLCIRNKSHLTQSLSKGKIMNMKTSAGDIVLWKQTTTHSANADVLAFLPNYSFHPRVARRFPKFLLQKTIRPRIGLFATFGIDDQYSHEYIEFLRSRTYGVNRWNKTKYKSNQVAEMKKKKVKVFEDFGTENLAIDKLNKDFVQL